MTGDKQFQGLVEKIQKQKNSGSLDLSTEEDLSIAIMNLLSLEEHFFFTGSKTGKDSYFDLLHEIREVRKQLLARMITKHEGETWCISKHLLATCMRLIEVGTKLQSDKNPKLAKETFAHAYKLYTLFWGLRLKLIKTTDLREIANSQKPWSLSDIVNNMVDCCSE